MTTKSINQPGSVDHETGRLCVTAREAFERPDPDSPLFMYCGDSEQWIRLEGIDPMVDWSAVDIWTYGGRCLSGMPVDTPVYLGRNESAERLAL